MKNPLKLLFLLLAVSCSGVGTYKTDVCIYGGTSAAVTAAKSAAQNGCRVIIICPDTVLGGMTTGGLGATDIGNKQAVIGMARQFYRDLGRHYGVEEQWTFEPSAAQAILDSYVDNPDISIYRGYYLSSVRKKGTRIVSITCTDGEGGMSRTIKASSFIDASYEGDLLAMAGVSYHVGREASSIYGEEWNGSHISEYHQFKDGVDPYVEKGNPDSGLLWGIRDWKLKEEGAGDDYIQAYNFRLCLSHDKDNQIPFTKPDDYDPSVYELLVRVFESDPDPQINNYFIWSLMPGNKTDVNNRGAFSTDMIGMNHDYPEASWERRKEIIAAHKSYTLGLMWFYVSDPRVPKVLQDFVREWGWAKDEYPATGGWTHQIYVREARRMISDYVATQADCDGRTVVEDGIGYAAYSMDSHNCERILVVKDGKVMVKNEGDVEKGVGRPYPVSYRSLVPRREECTNLLVPVCVSSSHIAYGSIRMEPVFLELGQVCGLAASLAGRNPVQDVDISRIREEVGFNGN
ncbi:MAG: FAD-dependent oxidoreductase [Bacteroidales bacterium]|nr:FAD-dependent oxidoreductase [Bacteroidales bacterium]